MSNSFLGNVHNFDDSQNKSIESTPQADSRGFDLQPIVPSNDEISDDSPPTESLKSIKSIAEERKKKIMERTKTLQKDLNRVTEEISKKNTTPKSKSKYQQLNNLMK